MPSNQKHVEHFIFPQFTGRRGLFVIEFIGNGLTSRAIIQKGALSMVSKSTIAGHYAYILDEHQVICKGKQTGIYFDNNFYPTDKDTGKIHIPFGKSVQTYKAILIHGEFSQLTEFTREAETYQFSASIVLHNETVVMGNVAKILVKPMLVINNREIADLRLLENTQITLQTINRIDSITQSKIFEEVALNDSEEYIIEFQVPPNLDQIRVTLNTTVNAVSKGEKLNFQEVEVFEINNHSSDYEFCEAFLRQVDGEYQYMIKGKNGEPISGVLIDFSFAHLYFVDLIPACHKTDSTGTIYLGKLKDVKFFTACPRASRIVQSKSKTWVLPKKCHIKYPNGQILTFLDSETIRLPFMHSEIKPTNFYLVQQSPTSKEYIENHISKAQLIKNPRNKIGINYLQISGLEEGQYVLWLKKEDVRMTINVYSGKYWNMTSSFLISQRALISRATQRIDCLRIDDVSVDGNKVKVSIGGDINFPKARIHAWAFNFLPFDLQHLLSKKLGKSSVKLAQKSFDFSHWKNMYLENRQLSDENRYIFERKLQEQQAGILLEKPSILLKRNFIRDTKFEEEKLNEGTNYDKIEGNILKSADMELCDAREYKQSARFFSKMAFDTRATNRYDYYPSVCGAPFTEPLHGQSNQQIAIIEGFQNFLANAADKCLNIKPDQAGVCSFEMELESYTTLLVVASTEDQSCHYITPIISKKRQDLQRRDLSLLKALDQTKHFSETRRTANCLKGDKYIVEDITSTEMQLIDSLEKIWMVQKDLINLNVAERDFVSVLLKWQSFTREEKVKHFSEYFSHELNVYLKLKDKEFFEEAVRPFLTNKIEKTLVDYWLLDDQIGIYISIWYL